MIDSPQGPAQKLLLVAIVLGFGICVGFFVGRVSAPTTAPSLDLAPTTPTSDSAPESIAAAPGDTAPPELEPAPREPDSVLQGQTLLSGTVTDQGRPVVDVHMKAWPAETPSEYLDVELTDSDVDRYVRNRTDYAQWLKARTFTTRTDSDGRFEFTNLPDLKYRVGATKHGYQFEYHRGPNFRFWDVERGIHFLAKSVVQLTLDVVILEGGRVNDARVSYRRPQGSWVRHDWNPSHRTLSIEPGRWEFRATSGAEFASNVQTLDVSKDMPLRIPLVQRTLIRVTVDRPLDEMEGAIYCWWQAITPGQRVDPDELIERRPLTANGRYAIIYIRNLTPGSYAVGVGRRPFRIDEYSVVEAHVGTNELEMSVPSLATHEHFVVRVHKADGTDPRNVEFEGVVRSHDDYDSYGFQTLERPDGSYWLFPGEALLDALEDNEQRLYLSAEIDDFRREVELQRVGQEVLIELGPTGAISVAVEGELEAEGRWRLRLHKLGTESGSRQRVHIQTRSLEESNELTFDPVEYGEYEVSLLHNWTEIASAPAPIRSGAAQVRLVAPRLYTLTVDVGGGDTDVSLSATGGFDESFETEYAESGDLIFRGVKAGTYELFGKLGRMSVSITGDTHVEFEPEPINALRVVGDGNRVVNSLVEGDLIFAFNDDEFENMHQLEYVAAKHLNEGTVRLSVDRAGRVIEIEIEVDSFRDVGSLGPATRSGHDPD